MSYYRNRQDRSGINSKDGEKAEIEFKNILARRNKSFRDATALENMKQHFDVVVTNDDGSQTRFEVKARKKRARYDEDYDDTIIWVEFQNGDGNTGWLYGDADYVALERAKDFLIVERAKLAQFAESRCTGYSDRAEEALYKIYTRAKYGKSDMLAMVLTADVEPFAKQIISKADV